MNRNKIELRENHLRKRLEPMLEGSAPTPWFSLRSIYFRMLGLGSQDRVVPMAATDMRLLFVLRTSWRERMSTGVPLSLDLDISLYFE